MADELRTVCAGAAPPQTWPGPGVWPFRWGKSRWSAARRSEIRTNHQTVRCRSHRKAKRICLNARAAQGTQGTRETSAKVAPTRDRFQHTGTKQARGPRSGSLVSFRLMSIAFEFVLIRHPSHYFTQRSQREQSIVSGPRGACIFSIHPHLPFNRANWFPRLSARSRSHIHLPLAHKLTHSVQP